MGQLTTPSTGKRSTLNSETLMLILHLSISLTCSRCIVDDQYEHVLRLFRDRDSGAVRLQASVRRGEFKKCGRRQVLKFPVA